MTDWFPQELATEFYYTKGAAALLATVLLIVHMNVVWVYVTKAGQRMRYLTLLYFAVLVTYSSAEQIQLDEIVNTRNVASLVGIALLIATMVVSIKDVPVVDLHVVRLPQRDPRLGRHVVHDPQSRSFAFRASAVDTSTWTTRLLRVYDPIPNPDQVIGNCTGCAQAMMHNTAGNRIKGVVLNMAWADSIYSTATKLDPFPGTYKPDDTGSSLLAAAKASQMANVGGRYEWIFNRADGVVQAVMAGKTVNVGTEWFEGMFNINSSGRIEPVGRSAGGHSWIVRGYDARRDWVRGRCWWGGFRDFWIKREHLDDLLADDGEALVQERLR